MYIEEYIIFIIEIGYAITVYYCYIKINSYNSFRNIYKDTSVYENSPNKPRTMNSYIRTRSTHAKCWLCIVNISGKKWQGLLTTFDYNVRIHLMKIRSMEGWLTCKIAVRFDWELILYSMYTNTYHIYNARMYLCVPVYIEHIIY